MGIEAIHLCEQAGGEEFRLDRAGVIPIGIDKEDRPGMGGAGGDGECQEEQRTAKEPSRRQRYACEAHPLARPGQFEVGRNYSARR